MAQLQIQSTNEELEILEKGNEFTKKKRKKKEKKTKRATWPLGGDRFQSPRVDQ